MLTATPTVIAHIGGFPVEERVLFAPYGASLAIAARTAVVRANPRQRQTRDRRIP